LIKRAAFTETSIDLNPGDTFLLYTDGLLLWSKDEHRRLSPRQLEQMLDHCAPSAEALLQTILVRTASGNSAKTAPDDLAAMAVRRADGQ
jgi:serine phosphatase RsbU (regulator of sigma subunit)